MYNLDKVKLLLYSSIHETKQLTDYCIKDISNTEAQQFMNQFIDTYTESKYNYGLFMSNKLIQIMSIDIDSICRITNLCPHIMQV